MSVGDMVTVVSLTGTESELSQDRGRRCAAKGVIESCHTSKNASICSRTFM
jgi:hypothetical protein